MSDIAKRLRQKQTLQRFKAPERVAVGVMRREAREHGSTLRNAGVGGLSPSLVLGVMRRDKYKCKRCGRDGTESGGLGVHHKGGLDNPPSAWLRQMGKRNTAQNLVVLCESCHNDVHDADRAVKQ